MRTGKCRHFNGLLGPGMKKDHVACSMGLNVKQFRAPNGNLALPCISEPSAPSCPKFEPFTKEELAEQEAEINRIVERFRLVGPLISKVKKEHKGEGWVGVVSCPVCKGKLHLSHAAINGHVWGKCGTKGCLAWME